MSDEIDQVIGAGMCVGCGACAAARPQDYAMQMTPAGNWQAQRKEPAAGGRVDVVQLCPMAGRSQNETEIAARLYPELPVDPQIGRHRNTFAAHVTQSGFRADGGSGGLVSWVATELLRRGEIDGVLHVKPVDPLHNDGLLFRYAISKTVEEVALGAKSRYYPIEMSQVLAQLDPSKRYAVVGLPCFLKAIRLLQDGGLLAPGQVPFTLGLVCGHLKSRYFAEYLALQKGAGPDSVASFDFRRKLMDRRASDYGFAFRKQTDQAGQEAVWPMASVHGRDWGEGLFKNAACEYCDDVLAECADIAIGDAWLPDYIADPLGTNIVVTRHALIDQIVREGVERGAVVLGNADVKAVIQSQSSGLRHRREGLAHRLARRQRRGEWIPAKRVAPALAPSRQRRRIYDARLDIAERSAALYASVRQTQQPLRAFERRIRALVVRYRKAGQDSRLRVLARHILHRLRSAWRR